MLKTILSPITEDLENMYCLLKKECSYIMGYVGDLTGVEHLSVKMAIRPALVILPSRIYGGNPKTTATLAAVMQLIYLASKVHDAFSYNEPVSNSKSCAQLDGDRFSVLLGDFFYSKASVILVESGIKGMIYSLANIVSQMQEGRIQRSRLTIINPDTKISRVIIRKETAELFAGCCMLGARLAGAEAQEQENMACFGRNFGMAFGLSEAGASTEQIAYYVDKGQKALLPAPKRTEKVVLEQLVKMLSGSGMNLQRLVG